MLPKLSVSNILMTAQITGDIKLERYSLIVIFNNLHERIIEAVQ